MRKVFVFNNGKYLEKSKIQRNQKIDRFLHMILVFEKSN